MNISTNLDTSPITLFFSSHVALHTEGVGTSKKGTSMSGFPFYDYHAGAYSVVQAGLVKNQLLVSNNLLYNSVLRSPVVVVPSTSV